MRIVKDSDAYRAMLAMLDHPSNVAGEVEMYSVGDGTTGLAFPNGKVRYYDNGRNN